MYVYIVLGHIYLQFSWNVRRDISILVISATLSPLALNSMQLRQSQRIPNDLLRTRLSCGRMIRFIAHPLPPSPVSNMSLFLSLPVCRLSSLLTEEGGGTGWARSQRQVIWPRRTLAIYFMQYSLGSPQTEKVKTTKLLLLSLKLKQPSSRR